MDIVVHVKDLPVLGFDGDTKLYAAAALVGFAAISAIYSFVL